MRSFRKGDKIKCIYDEDTNITLGKIYVATATADYGNTDFRIDKFVDIVDDKGNRVNKFQFKFMLCNDCLPEDLFTL